MNPFIPSSPQPGTPVQRDAISSFAESLTVALQDVVGNSTVSLIRGFLDTAQMQGYQTIGQLNNDQAVSQVLGNTRLNPTSPAKAKPRPRKVDPGQPEYGCCATVKPRNGVPHQCTERAAPEFNNLLCKRHGAGSNANELMASFRSQNVQPRAYVNVKKATTPASPGAVFNQAPLVPQKVQIPGTNLWICHGDVLNGAVLSPSTNGTTWTVLAHGYGVYGEDGNFVLHVDPLPAHYIQEIGEGRYNTPGNQFTVVDMGQLASLCEEIKGSIGGSIVAIHQNNDTNTLNWIIQIMTNAVNPSQPLPKPVAVAKPTPLFDPATQAVAPINGSPYTGSPLVQPVSPYTPNNQFGPISQNGQQAPASPSNFGTIGVPKQQAFGQINSNQPAFNQPSAQTTFGQPVFGQAGSPFPAPSQMVHTSMPQHQVSPQPVFGQINAQQGQQAVQPASGQVGTPFAPANQLQRPFQPTQPVQQVQPAFGQPNGGSQTPTKSNPLNFGLMNSPASSQPVFGATPAPTNPIDPSTAQHNAGPHEIPQSTTAQPTNASVEQPTNQVQGDNGIIQPDPTAQPTTISTQ